MKHRNLQIILLIGLSALFLGSCGKEGPDQLAATTSNVEPPDGSIKVIGNGMASTQCLLFGTMEEPKPYKLKLWECPLNIKSVELTKLPQTLVFAVDCKRKQLSVRSTDLPPDNLDSLWDLLPDGTFNVEFPGGLTVFKEDGAGHSDCISFPTIELRGKADCSKPDHPFMKDTYIFWNIGKSTRPRTGKWATGTLNECKFESKCYLGTTTDLKQCR